MRVGIYDPGGGREGREIGRQAEEYIEAQR
jgi:hypothetical protein